MKNLSLLLLAIVGVFTSHAQFLTQSAEGKSSIPLPLNGVGLSVDVGKSEIALGFNNYENVFSQPKQKSKPGTKSGTKSKAVIFYGINLSGKNSEGLANLFDGGDIVPQGNLLGFLGQSWSNNGTLSKLINDPATFAEVDSLKAKKSAISVKEFPDSIKIAIAYYLNILPNDASRDSMRSRIQRSLDQVSSNQWLDQIKQFDPGEDLCKPLEGKCHQYLDSLSAAAARILEYFVNKDIQLEKEIVEKSQEITKVFWKKHSVQRATAFLIGGIQARSFKRYLGLSTPDLTKSFQDTLFRGGQFGLGVNLQYRDIWFGVTYSYLKTDNFSNLSSKDYTFRRTDTAGGQALVQEKKITAYPGKYSRVEVNEINADLVISIKLNPSDTTRLLLNPYLRGLWHSRDTAFLQNKTDLGLGAYFLGNKRKFIGGIYIEWPDINNNREKAKPADEQNIRPALKKLTFGITTKFNISSLFSFSDRPRTPDK